MKQVNFTFNSSLFEKFSLPKYNATSFNLRNSIPNIEFNKTYYTYYNNELTAFQLYVCSFGLTSLGYGKSMFLIVLPNETMWVNSDWFNQPIFESVEHYINCVENGTTPKVEWVSLNSFSEIKAFSNKYDEVLIEFEKSFYVKNGIIKNTESIIDSIFIAKDIITFILRHPKTSEQFFETYDKCKASLLNNLSVKCFKEDVITKPIQFEIEVKEVVTKKYKLTEI